MLSNNSASNEGILQSAVAKHAIVLGIVDFCYWLLLMLLLLLMNLLLLNMIIVIVIVIARVGTCHCCNTCCTLW